MNKVNEYLTLIATQFSCRLEAGTDEAGRGCIAGPVTAAAVMLPSSLNLPFLNDSKQLSEKQRYELRPLIEAKAIAFAYAHIYPREIDQINILNASIKAMHLALMRLKKRPEFIAVDGNRFHSFENITHHCIIKGDAKYLNIAAASVLAKTYRDDYMDKIHEEYPDYLWRKNKGYPTKAHRAAIKLKGITPHHRKSFQLVSKQFEIDFNSE